MSGDYKLIYKGGENEDKIIGLIYKEDVDKKIEKIMPISDRF